MWLNEVLCHVSGLALCLKKCGNGNSTLLCKASTVKLYARNLMEGIRREITRAAIWATHNGDVFDDEEVLPFAITSAHTTNTRSFFSANIANHGISVGFNLTTAQICRCLVHVCGLCCHCSPPYLRFTAILDQKR